MTFANRSRIYGKFVAAFRFFAEWRVVGFDQAQPIGFENCGPRTIRIPTSDLKIASICLVNDATLLSRNLADFMAGFPGAAAWRTGWRP